MRSSLHQRRVKDDRARDDEHVARPLRSLLSRFLTKRRFDPRRLRDGIFDLHARSPIDPARLGEVYQSLVAQSRGAARKRGGIYYTPPELVQLLTEQTLPARRGTLSAPSPNDSATVLDPACGCGGFLLAAMDQLGPGSFGRLRGIDIDPVAAELCRIAIAIQSGRLDAFRQLELQIRCCDAIVESPTTLFQKLAVADGFDVILTNPPFVNAIENPSERAYREDLATMHPLIKGAADYSCYFLSQALRLIRPGGTIGMVLPRSSLNAPALSELRTNLPAHLRPNLIVAPDSSQLFPGAQVFVCALVLGNARRCRVARSLDLRDLRVCEIETENWWSAVCRTRESSTHAGGGVTVDSQFEVHASMTAADAYDLRAFIVDRPLGPGQKLLTTGLIDPGVCKWGVSKCRYLGRDFACPRVVLSGEATASLKRRLNESRRPKLIVAGLSKRIECFLDAAGECVGAVSTYSIFHPRDDVQALTHLAAVLSSRNASRLFVEQLGGNAMGGGNMTMKREFLRKFPLRSGRLAG